MPRMKPDGYKWDGDSRDERETELGDSVFSTTRGGAYHSSWAQDRVRRSHKRKRKRKQRVSGIVWASLGVIATCALLIYGVIGRLHH